MNTALLFDLWQNYWAQPEIRRTQRFGQYFYNQTNFETERSFYEENDFVAYNDILAELLVKEQE